MNLNSLKIDIEEVKLKHLLRSHVFIGSKDHESIYTNNVMQTEALANFRRKLQNRDQSYLTDNQKEWLGVAVTCPSLD